jgi:hypothetical protein
LTPKPAPPKQIPDIFTSFQFNIKNRTRKSHHTYSRRGQNFERMVETVKPSVHETIDKSKKKIPGLEESLNPVPPHEYSTGLSLHMNVDRACQGACLILFFVKLAPGESGDERAKIKSNAQLPGGTP